MTPRGRAAPRHADIALSSIGCYGSMITTPSQAIRDSLPRASRSLRPLAPADDKGLVRFTGALAGTPAPSVGVRRSAGTM